MGNLSFNRIDLTWHDFRLLQACQRAIVLANDDNEKMLKEKVPGRYARAHCTRFSHNNLIVLGCWSKIEERG